jgi:CheY-like chemotaxis protein
LPKGLNGIQVVVGLRETLGHQIPAVILTGDISTSALREIAQGGHLHLNKPVRARELMELIRRCLADLRPPVPASAQRPCRSGRRRPANTDNLRGRR